MGVGIVIGEDLERLTVLGDDTLAVKGSGRAVLDVVAVVAGAAAVEAVLPPLPHAASTNALKLAAPAPPAIFRNRLRSTSSRTRRSTIPTGRGSDSSLGEPDILLTSTSTLFPVNTERAVPRITRR